MELEEIQAVWSEMSDQLKKQKKLTNDIIMEMTQNRYSNKFKTLSIYESFGAVICYATAVHILINFTKLDTWYLISCGIITIAFLLILPILVLKFLARIKNLNILQKSYKETLVNYTKAKTNLLKLQQFSIYTSFILMFAVAAVFSKIWSDRDFFTVERDSTSYVVIGIALLFAGFFSRWGYNHYKKLTNSAEDIIKELE